ncbi:tail fiber protein, partial [Desulfovibrio sp. ZJ200]|uniref:tail fiber protein n=1 Tax=Desulfovibrio sp. ZJ200 TaxID=2709792 RepID=UPI00197FE089
MAYPKILQRLFENSGAGPRLRKEILPFGSTPGTACEGNDARLSNARVPEMHKETHQSGGADALTPEDIGAHPAGGMASADKAGIARLSSAVDLDSEDRAATPKAVKVTHELAARAKADAAAAQARADSAHAEAGRAASTTSSGRVQLSSALNSDSEALAATPKAVKAVYSEAVKSASLTQAGRVKLNNTVSSTSAAEAATANA